MNPFDGKYSCAPKDCPRLFLIEYSDQATNASPWLDIPFDSSMRPQRLQKRRPCSILRFLPDNALHDSTIYSYTVHGLRIPLKSYEPK